MIRAVTFDFWNTLYEEGPARDRRQRLREEYAGNFLMGLGRDVTASQLNYAFGVLWHDLEHYRMVRHTSFGAEEMGRRLAEAMGVELEAPDAARLGELVSSATCEAPPVPVDGVRGALAALRRRVKLAVISDTGITLGCDLYLVMETDGIAQRFDHFTFSDQTGTTKPETRQFHYTLYRLGCTPDEAVHVGDLEETDVAGARQAGMRAIRVVRPGCDGQTCADAAVDAVADVLGVLRKWDVQV